MKCSHCGLCCQDTEMELSDRDVKRLERLGYSLDEFSTSSEDSPRQLRNVDGHCFFYDAPSRSCRVYPHRPFGCRVYPVVYIVGEGIDVDSLCPMSYTFSEFDLRVKGKSLLDHLERIDKKT
ncbi:YkgJ family cysteine cluster protein [Candidatus Bathyarchaeota archaeon]|nr:YkgJ family cysteine cluster protein [Candidatus Bathyarchaeota archaeon]